MNKLQAVIAFIVVLYLSMPNAIGATYYVATTGSSSGDGSSGKPFRWPQEGINLAKPGDKVVVKPGVYVCRITFYRSGTYNAGPGTTNYITLEGEPGAVIVGGYDVSKGWVAAPEKGAGVYKKVTSISGTPFSATIRPQNLFYNDKMILHIKDSNLTGGAGWSRLADPSSSTNWINVGALHGSETKVYTITTYLRFADNRDPNQGTIYVSGHQDSQTSAAITISGQDYIKIRGFSLRNSSVSVLLTNGASYNVIENNDIYGAKEGVYIVGSDTDIEANLCHGNHIRNNNITLDFFADLNYTNVYANNSWTWDQFKTFSDNDREAVGLNSAGHDNKVYNNHIYKHWGGIQDWATVSGTLANKDYCKRLEVYGNTIHDILDDALEPTGGEIDAQWHDNNVSCSTVGIRLKGIESSGGPAYFYRNKIFIPTVKGASSRGIYFFSETDAEIYIYNNSFSGLSAYGCFGMQPHLSGTGYPNTWVINNIFSNAGFLYGETWWDANMNAKFYNNWFGGKYRYDVNWAAPPAWFGTGNIIENNVLLWDSAAPTFTIPADSSCCGKGLDISVPWSPDGKIHDALPGVPKLTGVNLDIGAFQYDSDDIYTPPANLSGPVKMPPVNSKSDLIVNKVWWDTPPVAGQPLTVNFEISNIGTAKTAAGSGVQQAKVYLNNVRTDVKSYDDIAVKGKVKFASIIRSALIESGKQCRVMVWADATDKVPEIRETNNTNSVNFLIESRPDLLVKEIALSPKPAANKTLTIYFKISNVGASATIAGAGAQAAAVFVDGKPVGVVTYDDVQKGGSISRQLALPAGIATSGTHKIKIYADTNNIVNEINELNNSLEKSFTFAR